MSKSIENKLKLFIISILSFVGFLISAYQTSSFFELRSGTAMGKRFCDIGSTFDCTAIEISRYAELVPGIPLSGFALAGYLLIAFLALWARFGGADNKNDDTEAQILPWLKFLGFISLAFSAIYLLIMILAIKKLCLLCLVIDAINAAIFAFVLTLKNEAKTTWAPISKPFYTSAIAAVVIAFLVSLALNPTAKMKSEDLADWKSSILSGKRISIQIPENSPTLGTPDAKITIVKFSDYQCPMCKMSAATVHALAKRYGNDVRFVFLNFPLSSECNAKVTSPMHVAACDAARAATCANQQGKFDEAYTALFDAQENLPTEKALGALAKSSLDLKALETCMNQPSTNEKVMAEAALGSTLGIEATPTFFVDGLKIEGGLPTHLWIEILDTMLAQKK